MTPISGAIDCFMTVEFDDDDLDRLETDPRFTAGLDQAIVKAYRRRMQTIRTAPDERTFYKSKGMHFEKLKGGRKGQHSIKLNNQWLLIIELRGTAPNKVVGVVEIVDYH